MSITSLLQEAQKFEIQIFKKIKKSLKDLHQTHVAFSGCPLKHPHDPDKVLIVVDPFSANTFYYEFKTNDVAFIEELPSIVNLEGETIIMARLWIKKKTIGVRSTPFVVEDIGSFLF